MVLGTGDGLIVAADESIVGTCDGLIAGYRWWFGCLCMCLLAVGAFDGSIIVAGGGLDGSIVGTCWQ